MEPSIRKNVLRLWQLGIELIEEDLYIDEIHDTQEGKIIILRGKDVSGPELKVHFNEALSYRNTDESFLLKIWNDTPKDLLGHTFYEVENSEYLDFFYEMTQGLYDDWKVFHFAIYTQQDCIDILSLSPPVAEWVNGKE